MNIEKLSSNHCGICRCLALVQDAWSMLILRDAGRGMTHFCEFQESLGIAPNTLCRKLRAMTEAGLFTRVRYSERPPRYAYALTLSGSEFLPIIDAIDHWGRDPRLWSSRGRSDAEIRKHERPGGVDASRQNRTDPTPYAQS